MLYKYYAPVDHNFEAIEKGYFFMSQAKFVNDPFDITMNLLSDDLIKAIYGQIASEEFKKTAMKDYRLCCFSKEKDNKRLWASYADNYKGFCVGFDENQFKQLDGQIIAGMALSPVTYIKEPLDIGDNNEIIKIKNMLKDDEDGVLSRPLLELINGNEHLKDSLFLYLCTLKEEKTWEIEHEIRLIGGKLFCQLSNQNVKQKKCEGGTILKWGNTIKPCEIILGHNMTEDNKYRLKKSFEKYYIFQTKPLAPFKIDIQQISK